MDVTTFVPEIKAPHYMRNAITLWLRFLPGEFVPVHELRALILKRQDPEAVELAIEHCGEAGNLSVEEVRVEVERWQQRRQREERKIR